MEERCGQGGVDRAVWTGRLMRDTAEQLGLGKPWYGQCRGDVCGGAEQIKGSFIISLPSPPLKPQIRLKRLPLIVCQVHDYTRQPQ